jgi:hypothetical protein
VENTQILYVEATLPGCHNHDGCKKTIPNTGIPKIMVMLINMVWTETKLQQIL